MRVIQANPPSEELTGKSLEQMLGRPCGEVFDGCETLC